MPNFTTINFALSISNRAQMRKDLINQFIQENPGTGNGNLASRYIYHVESFGKYGIYLKRPTRLNKGFDFTVNISGMSFKKNRIYSNPSHSDIISALTYCKNNFQSIYQVAIKQSIQNIYTCKKVVFNSPSGAKFLDYNKANHPIEIILLALKWLFMEQDCAYWNYSGRAMLYDTLKNNSLL